MYAVSFFFSGDKGDFRADTIIGSPLTLGAFL